MGILSKRHRLKVLSELMRKSWHFFAGLTMVIGFSMFRLHFSNQAALITLTGFLLAAMIFEHVRLEHKPRLFEIFNILFRQKELCSPSAMIPFLISGVLVFAVFPYWIAFTALMMLMIGDSASAAFGMYFGKKKIKGRKTYVGTFAGLIANLLTGFVLMYERPLIFISMAIVASIVEMLTDKLEDNLTVPISTAFCGYLIAMAFGIVF